VQFLHQNPDEFITVISLSLTLFLLKAEVFMVHISLSPSISPSLSLSLLYNIERESINVWVTGCLSLSPSLALEDVWVTISSGPSQFFYKDLVFFHMGIDFRFKDLIFFPSRYDDCLQLGINTCCIAIDVNK
jgi:hypothetical protein